MVDASSGAAVAVVCRVIYLPSSTVAHFHSGMRVSVRQHFEGTLQCARREEEKIS